MKSILYLHRHAPHSTLATREGLDAVLATGPAQDSYVEVLPLIPRLPASTIVYEGAPL